MRVYYAHPIDIYNTMQEVRDVELLTNVFCSDIIINPNSRENEVAYQTIGMSHFLEIVDECDLLVFRGYPMGRIPAGVWKEISRAREKNIPVLELPTLVDRAMSVDDTRQFIKEIGTR